MRRAWRPRPSGSSEDLLARVCRTPGPKGRVRRSAVGADEEVDGRRERRGAHRRRSIVARSGRAQAHTGAQRRSRSHGSLSWIHPPQLWSLEWSCRTAIARPRTRGQPLAMASRFGRCNDPLQRDVPAITPLVPPHAYRSIALPGRRNVTLLNELGRGGSRDGVSRRSPRRPTRSSSTSSRREALRPSRRTTEPNEAAARGPGACGAAGRVCAPSERSPDARAGARRAQPRRGRDRARRGDDARSPRCRSHAPAQTRGAGACCTSTSRSS